MVKLRLKTAAMFGLDARIALAIFGALSVISSAALYSAIQQARVVALVNQMQEIAKAYEAFYLDTSTHMSRTGNSIYAGPLFTSTLSGWNGPYLSLKSDSTYLLYENGTNVFATWETDEWGVDTDGTAGGDLTCDSGDTCSIWLSAYNIDRNIAEAVDLYVDGANDPKNGNIRLYGTDDTPHIWLKVMPWPNN